jgi:CRP/FNR family cyclic AMP-dependent transcriptional regulator
MTEPIEPGNENRLDIVELLGRVDLFKHLEPETRQALASRMRMVYMLEGHIIRDNDPVDGLYIIESGRAKVIKASESRETEAVLALLQPGSSFGEISLIDGLPRTATVTTMEPTWCYFLPRDAFISALEENP